LVSQLDEELDRDDDLSQALIPEVWNVARKKADIQGHSAERRRFLRILVLREVATGVRQRIGLEPWGRLIVDYAGLEPSLAFFQNWSGRLGLSAGELCDGIAAVLDFSRRNRLLLDRDGRIFSKIWQEGDREIANGYLPLFRGGPKGLKLQRDPGDESSRVTQWLGSRPTAVSSVVERWGVDRQDVQQFLQELWLTLTDELHLIVPATLTGWQGRPLPGTTNVRQIDADLLRLRSHEGLWRCHLYRQTIGSVPAARGDGIAWRSILHTLGRTPMTVPTSMILSSCFPVSSSLQRLICVTMSWSENTCTPL
jgi:hypothetical protein